MILPKRLLVSIPIGMSARNIIHTDVFLEISKNFNLVIMSHFTPKQLIPRSVNTLADHITIIKYIDLNQIQKMLIRLYRRIDIIYFWSKFKTATLKRHIEKLKQESFVKYLLLFKLAVVWNTMLKIGLGQKIISFIYKNKAYERILKQYDIDALFVPSYNVKEDMLLMNAAKRIGIPIVCSVHSWDNLPVRGSLIAEPDLLLVWNNIMMEQAQILHCIPKEKIRVIGLPQYDYYTYKTPLLSKKEYMQKINIEKYEKIITYTCSAERVFPDEDVFLLRLIELVQKKTFGNAILIIRLHPTERIKQYLKLFKGKKDILIDVPGGSFAATYVSSIEHNDIQNFVNLIKHSDVVINLASTVTIDASIFNVPVVNVAYNTKLPPYAWNAAKKWYKTTHYNNVVKTQGIRIARSEEELIRYIQDYLRDPTLDKEGRERLIKEQCYKIDGKATERILSALENAIG